jgi:hypothetical protein
LRRHRRTSLQPFAATTGAQPHGLHIKPSTLADL